MERCRTSPAADTPGWLVSSCSGDRCRAGSPLGAPAGMSVPVRMKPWVSRKTVRGYYLERVLLEIRSSMMTHHADRYCPARRSYGISTPLRYGPTLDRAARRPRGGAPTALRLALTRHARPAA